MNSNALNILVVDDKREAGLQIVDALWEGGFSVQFEQYDPKRLMRLKKQAARMRGVRIVFMDINLIGGAMGSDGQNFGAIQVCLQTLLAKDNGPYLLITWSSHDDYADRLFAFLNERLPIEYRPISTKRLSKTDFSGKNKTKLPVAVKQILSNLGIAGCLIDWESLVREASSATLNTVSKLASDLPDHVNHSNREQKLGAVIRAFSEAEAADHLTNESAFPALSTVLIQVLNDEVTSILPKSLATHGVAIMAMGKIQSPEWGSRVHRALHIEYGGIKRMHAPGDVFAFPAYAKIKRGGLPKLKLDVFLAEQFFDLKKWQNMAQTDKDPIINDSRLILAEITPPCDHATLKKLLWHRYVLGVELGPAAIKSLIKADYLLRLPKFVSMENKAFTLVLNSRATVTIPPDSANELGARLYRLRSQLFADVIRWVSAQQARLGYVTIS
jgi:CheY-like chemotaxis protein